LARFLRIDPDLLAVAAQSSPTTQPVVDAKGENLVGWHLNSISGRTAELWEQIEQLIATRQSKSYDLAIQHLADLHDLAARKGTQSEFATRIASLRQAHARKPGVLARLNEKGW